jgi:large-conductance mechanosensitive channel
MKKNKLILVIVFFLFVGVMIFFTVDFMSRTTTPWERKKDTTFVNKYKVQYNEKLGLKNIDSLMKAREGK